MSLEEALKSLESRGPEGGGDWRPWRKLREEAVKLLEKVPAEALEPVIPRLSEICRTASQTDTLNVAALHIVRYCAATGKTEPVQSLATTMSHGYHYALFDGLRDAVDLGADVWPLVQPLLPAHADRLDQVLSKLVMKRPALLSELAPDLAMKTVVRAGLWQQATLTPFADVIIETYLRETGEAKADAARGLSMAAQQPGLLPMEKLEARFAIESGEEAQLLARILLQERIKRSLDLEPLLTDSRSLVRLGAYEALSRNADRWSRLLEGLLDPDADVRKRVLEFAHLGIEEGRPFDEELGRRVIATGREELLVFMSFVATKYPALKPAWLRELPPSALPRTFEAKATRACARCRSIPHAKTWTSEVYRPEALSLMAAVPESTLLRCPECWAHFSIDHWEEYDVNSKREEWTLRRLKLSELKQRPDFDQSHPRVATWEAALQEDLQHIEPSVRAEAKWELGE